MKQNKHFSSLKVIIFFFSVLFFTAGNVKAQEKSGWVKENNQTYLYYNGAPVTGFWVVNNNIYYFDENGVKQTGVITVQGKTYYCDPDINGVVNFGWFKIQGKDYYFSRNGTVGTHMKVKNVKGRYKNGSILGSHTPLSKKQWKQTKNKVIKFINSKIATNMEDWEKVGEAYKYLINTASYSFSSNYSKTKSNTAYGVLVRKKAQCSGFTKGFIAICDALSIKTKYVRETKGSHQWCVVKIKGKWYHVDLTYNAFLESDRSRVKDDLKWSKKIPKCKTDFVEPYITTVPYINGNIIVYSSFD